MSSTLQGTKVGGSPESGSFPAALWRSALRFPAQLHRLLERGEDAGLRPLPLAFALCLMPRAVALAVLGPIGDYRVFADPEALTEAHWYPLYRALAEILWSVSAGSVAVFVTWHLALHAALGPIVYATARRLRLSSVAAWLAVLGVACLPYYVAVAARQPQVGVVISFVAMSFWCFLVWRDRNWDWKLGVVFAAVCFVSAVLRPNLLLTDAALYGFAIISVIRAGQARTALPRILASGTLVALMVFGLAAESRMSTGHWSPFQPITGYNVWLGHNERVGEYLRRYDVLSVEDVTRNHGLPASVVGIADPYERDAALGRLGVAHILANPGVTVQNTLWKAWRWWDIRLEDAERNPLWWNLTYSAPYLVYGVLALFGAAQLWRSRRRASIGLVALMLSTYWLPHLVLFPTIRMRMTTEFLLVLLAAVAAAKLLEHARAATRETARERSREGEVPAPITA
jgi:hypothetical protein